MERDILVKVQKIQLEMAKDVKRICDENGIRYFLYRGTFLGAVRHKGVIPWDDDMDFGMLREDYEKFCAIANEKLDSQYCFQNWHTDDNYALPLVRSASAERFLWNPNVPDCRKTAFILIFILWILHRRIPANGRFLRESYCIFSELS